MRCLSMLLFTIIGSSVVAAQQSPSNPYEFGFEVGATRNRGTERTPRTSVPVSVRFGGIGMTHPFGAEARLSMFDERVRDGRPHIASSSQITYRFGSRTRLSRSVAGPYSLAGFTVVSASQVAERNSAASRRLLVGFHAGFGARLPFRFGYVRPEVFVAYDQGSSGATPSAVVPARRTIGARFGYSWVSF